MSERDCKLLTRDQFRNATFERDNHTCVFCDKPAVDAHHIMERRLFATGGYYIENGASVCAEHHLECEKTTISVEQVREACGIVKRCVPDHLYDDHIYDKWGNPVLTNGQRLRGELFYDESVQKILKLGGVLPLFTHWVKYPRTHHVPWTNCLPDDDRIIPSLERFEGQRVIVTEKMDGENCTMMQDHIHARSVDGRHHPSRDWVKNMWGQIRYEIPEQWRICGENMYAKHSIGYNNLPSYFMGFSVWDDQNKCLGWDDTQLWFSLLGIESVPVLYDDIFDQKRIEALWSNDMWDSCEGYVLRVADEFPYGDFRNCVAKFVRKDHVLTIKHWMHGQRIVPNQLKDYSNE